MTQTDPAGLTAVVCEYNPMHAGHLWHLRRTREQPGCSGVVLVMTGPFSQRGEFSLPDKFAKTELALRAGADLVLELPAAFSAAAADDFALYSVKMLNEIPAVRTLSFGSGCGDADKLTRVRDLLDAPDFRNKLDSALQADLGTGVSYSSAWNTRADELLAREGLGGVLKNSNDLLALSYLKALKQTNSPIRPLAVKRNGDYLGENSANGVGNVSGAGAETSVPTAERFLFDDGTTSPEISASTIRAICGKIRTNLGQSGEFSVTLAEALRDAVPETSLREIVRYFDNPIDEDAFYRILQYRFLSTPLSELAKINGMTEGLENRLVSKIGAPDFSAFLSEVSTRRYSLSRIRRAVVSAVLGIDKATVAAAKSEPPLLRVLGVRKEQRRLLSEFRIPPFVSQSERDGLSPAARRLAEIDLSAQNLYAICRSPQTGFNQDYTNGLILV